MVNFLILGIIDGSESIFNSFLINIFSKKYKLDDSMKSSYGTLLYSFVFLAILISGYIGDNFGRKNPMIFGIFISFIRFIN